MAHTFGLTTETYCDDCIDIDLTTGSYYLIDYTPTVSPNADVVTETAVIGVSSSTSTGVSDAIRDIQRAFDLADRRYDTQTGDRIYVKFQPDGYSTGTFYRSELVRPRPGVTAAYVDYEGDVLGGNWAAKELTVVLNWTRKNYWEDDGSTTLELSSANTPTATSTGPNVYMLHSDSTGVGDVPVILDDVSISFDLTTGTPTTYEIKDADNNFDFNAGEIICVVNDDGTEGEGVYVVNSASSGTLQVGVGNSTFSDHAAADAITIYKLGGYIDIAADQIEGDLPTPLTLQFRNLDSGALEKIWVSKAEQAEAPDGDFYDSDTSEYQGWVHHLDALEANNTDGTSTDAANASCETEINASIGTTEEKVADWTLLEGMLDGTKGQYFKVFAVFTSGTNVTDVKWRLKMRYTTSDEVIWEGEQIEFDDTYTTARKIREIDTIKLPPVGPFDVANWGAYTTLELYGESTTTGSVSVDIDCLRLLPAEDRGFREYTMIYPVDQNDYLMDAGYYDEIFYYDATEARGLAGVAVKGEKIYLRPNTKTRLYFLYHTETANTINRNHLVDMRIYIRPRRRTL